LASRIFFDTLFFADFGDGSTLSRKPNCGRMGLQSTAAWGMLANQSAGVCDDMGRGCDDENSRAGMPLAEPKESLTPARASASSSGMAPRLKSTPASSN
jgi:hypothetical protein